MRSQVVSIERWGLYREVGSQGDLYREVGSQGWKRWGHRVVFIERWGSQVPTTD